MNFANTKQQLHLIAKVMKINTAAQIMARHLQKTGKELQHAQDQAATGLKNPNPASDPLASSMAVCLKASLTTKSCVQTIVAQAKNTAEVAHGALNANLKILEAMRVLSLQASDGTCSPEAREQLNIVCQTHLQTIGANAQTRWGSMPLFDGDFAINIQTGSHPEEITRLVFADMTADTIFDDGLPALDTQEHAREAIATIDAARQMVLGEMTRTSAYATQFDNSQEALATGSQNLQGALSSIEDADFAAVVTNTQRLQALQEAATAMLKTSFSSFDRLSHLVGESLRGR